MTTDKESEYYKRKSLEKNKEVKVFKLESFFKKEEGEAVFIKGKYQKCDLGYVLEEDKSYIDWLKTIELTEEDKKILDEF